MKREKRNWCKCGCREFASPGKMFIHGHHTAKNPHRNIRKLCECGCGGYAKIRRRFISGHFRHTADTIAKFSADRLGKTNGRTGNKHPMFGRNHTPEAKAKISIAVSGENHPWYGRKHSEETKAKMSKAKKGKKASLKVKANMSKAQKEQWRNPEFVAKVKAGLEIRPTKPEIGLMEILDDLFPNEWRYVGDLSFMIDGKNPDFLNINGQKKLIELFGDYWHKGQDPQDRINIFKPFGFDTLVVWEHELSDTRVLNKKLEDFNLRG